MISLFIVPSFETILPKYLNDSKLGAINGDTRLFREGRWCRQKEDHSLAKADR